MPKQIFLCFFPLNGHRMVFEVLKGVAKWRRTGLLGVREQNGVTVAIVGVERTVAGVRDSVNHDFSL